MPPTDAPVSVRRRSGRCEHLRMETASTHGWLHVVETWLPDGSATGRRHVALFELETASGRQLDEMPGGLLAVLDRLTEWHFSDPARIVMTPEWVATARDRLGSSARPTSVWRAFGRRHSSR